VTEQGPVPMSYLLGVAGLPSSLLAAEVTVDTAWFSIPAVGVEDLLLEDVLDLLPVFFLPFFFSVYLITKHDKLMKMVKLVFLSCLEFFFCEWENYGPDNTDT
jgi:hypothetical protein